MDKAFKIAAIFGIILVAIALFYYFLIKPQQEQKAYVDCLSALKESGKFNDITINSPYGKSSLDVCTKSKGADKIRAEKAEKDKQAELKKQQIDQKVKDLKEQIDTFTQQIELKDKKEQTLANDLAQLDSDLKNPDLSEQDRTKLSQQYNYLSEQKKIADEKYQQTLEPLRKQLQEIQQQNP